MQTLREVLDKKMCMEGYSLTSYFKPNDRLLDLTIMPDVGFVATDLEAGAMRLAWFDAPPGRSEDDYWKDISLDARECRILDLNAILTACKIVPRDEVPLVAMDVEAGVEWLNWLAGDAADSANGKDEKRAEAFRAALTACKIIPADEDDDVYEVVRNCEFHTVEGGGCVVSLPHRFDGGWGRYKPGDNLTITITRKPSESPNGCTGKSVLHPPVNEGE